MQKRAQRPYVAKIVYLIIHDTSILPKWLPNVKNTKQRTSTAWITYSLNDTLYCIQKITYIAI